MAAKKTRKDTGFVSNEGQLVRTVVWDKNEISLSEFVSKYELPQLVCVETGYYGTDERSVLSSGQLLTLHKIYDTAKVVCEPSDRSAIVISVTCPDRAEVMPLPKDCEHSNLTAAALAELPDPKVVKYLRVIEVDSRNEGDCTVGEMLKLVEVCKNNSCIKCSNMARENHNIFSISFNSTTVFTPLIDIGRYTIVEIKAKFGFPAKVRFLESSTKQRETGEGLANFGDVLILGDYSDSIILATTVCDELSDKICIMIPKELEVTVVVPRALLSADNDSSYQRIIKTLHQGFEAARLDDFPDLDTEQHINAVREAMSKFSVNENETVEYLPSNARHILPDMRYKAYFNDTDAPPPPLIPRGTKRDTKPQPAPTSTKVPPSTNKTKPPPMMPTSKPSPKSPPVPPSPKSPPLIPSPYSPPVTPSSKTPPPTSTRPKQRPTAKTPFKKEEKTAAVPSSQQKKSSTFKNLKKKAFSFPGKLKGTFHDSDDVEKSSEVVKNLKNNNDDDDDDDYISMDDHEQNGSSSDDDSHNYEYIDNDHVYESFVRSDKKAPEYTPPPPSSASDIVYESVFDATTPDDQSKEDVEGSLLMEKRKIDLSKVPQDISTLNVQQIGDILITLNLHRFVDVFEREMIDGAFLKTMDESSLQALNIDKFHAHKLMLFISGWRPNL